MMPHYLMKFECLTVPLTATVVYRSGRTTSFTVNIFMDVNFSFTCLVD